MAIRRKEVVFPIEDNQSPENCFRKFILELKMTKNWGRRGDDWSQYMKWNPDRNVRINPNRTANERSILGNFRSSKVPDTTQILGTFIASHDERSIQGKFLLSNLTDINHILTTYRLPQVCELGTQDQGLRPPPPMASI
jgi:hypothetical protein